PRSAERTSYRDHTHRGGPEAACPVDDCGHSARSAHRSYCRSRPFLALTPRNDRKRMHIRLDESRRDTRRFCARTARPLRLLLAGAVLAGSLTLAPSAALASKLGSDRVGGYKVSSSRIATSTAPDITAKSGALVAGNRVLWSRKLDAQRAMASTTKIMTALVVLENCSLKETVKITK